MKKSVVASLVAITGLGLAPLGSGQRAAAADFAPRPLLTADSTWTGLYAGINLGGFAASGTAQWDPLPSPAAFGFNGTTGDLSTSGVTVGFQAGYNYQLAPAWVAGIEADITGDNVTSSTLSSWNALGTGAPLAGAFTKEIRTLQWLSTVRGRIGYLVTPWTLVYFTGGAAFTGVNYAAGNSAPITGGYATSVSFTETQAGYVLGGGVEFLTWDRWLVRGEYLFHHFGDVSAVGAAPNFPNFPSGYSWSGFDVHEVRAAVSFKF
jgi:outer membrane immunogenic protein